MMDHHNGTGVRDVFLRALTTTRPLLAHPRVEDGWHEASALERMTLGSLTAHLARAVFNVERYLDASPEDPGDEAIDAPGYFAAIIRTADLDDPIAADVRTRSDRDALEGWPSLVERFDAAVESLKLRLEGEPRTRKLRVFGGHVMRLDDYLITRLVECVVHADDLAISIGAPTPAFDAGVLEAAIGAMVDTARLRHGDIAVVRALSRRERDELDALRVF